MRILIIVQNYPPERGSVRYTSHLACGLARDGHHVTVITALPHYPAGSPYPGFGRWRTDRRIEDGVHVIRVPMIMASNRQHLKRIAGFLSFMLTALPSICLQPRADVIIASVPPPTVAGVGILASIVHRRRYIALLRDIEPLRLLTIRGMARSPLGRRLIEFAMWLYRRARHVVVVHPGEKETLAAHGFSETDISVIGHGIDTEWFRAERTSQPVVKVPSRPGHAIAVYAGTLGHVHALPQFLEAMSDDRIQRLPVDLVIVGDGEYRSQCEALIHASQLRNVHLLPSVALDDVPGILSQADILVCSFRDDSDAQLGSKFYDYCAAGKPILVHGRSAAADLIGEIGGGWACNEGDVDGLRCALDDFLQRRDYWERRGHALREYAHRHFPQHARDTEWAALLRRIVT